MQVPANVLVEDAQLTPLVSWLANYESRGKFKGLIEVVRRKSGGFWIGGRLDLLPDKVAFCPNTLNEAIIQAAPKIAIYYSEIISLNIQKAFISDILSVATASQTIKFRCRNAQIVARQIETFLHADVKL